jgi:RNA polymerase sigma factor (TIGR02999 family)
MEAPPGDLTRLLQGWNAGDAAAREDLMARVYGQLRRLAARQMRREHGVRTLSPTALVHEVYLRLAGQADLEWRDRAHFFGIVGVTMRRVLVEAARRRGAAKRGGEWRRITLGEQVFALEARGVDVLDLDRALSALAELDPRQARIVELRFFADLGVEETAEVLGLSPATVKRDWSVARAWLFRQLERGDAVHPEANPGESESGGSRGSAAAQRDTRHEGDPRA